MFEAELGVTCFEVDEEITIPNFILPVKTTVTRFTYFHSHKMNKFIFSFADSEKKCFLRETVLLPNFLLLNVLHEKPMHGAVADLPIPNGAL